MGRKTGDKVQPRVGTAESPTALPGRPEAAVRTHRRGVANSFGSEGQKPSLDKLSTKALNYVVIGMSERARQRRWTPESGRAEAVDATVTSTSTCHPAVIPGVHPSMLSFFFFLFRNHMFLIFQSTWSEENKTDRQNKWQQNPMSLQLWAPGTVCAGSSFAVGPKQAHVLSNLLLLGQPRG